MRLLASVSVLVLALCMATADHEEFIGVVVGNPKAAALCETIRPGQSKGLDMLRAHCGLEDGDLYPTMGYRNVALRDLASIGPGLAGLREFLTSSRAYGQACGNEVFRYLCYKYVPRCDQSGQNVVWNSTIVRQGCDSINSTCTPSQVAKLKSSADKVCVSGFEISGVFKIGECRTPDASLLSPNCSGMAAVQVPTYYHELYTKADQQFIKGTLDDLQSQNISVPCQQSYLGVACWPGFVCKDGLYRDLRQRGTCQKAQSCLEGTGTKLPVSSCSDLAELHSGSSAGQLAGLPDVAVLSTVILSLGNLLHLFSDCLKG